MKTISTTTIAVLPIGGFDTNLMKKESNTIIGAFNRLRTNLIIADPVSDEGGTRQSVQVLSEKYPDLLLINSLRGVSANAIETVVLTSHVPTLISPLRGRFALSSSGLAV
jgi:hypothetical protein